MGNNQSQDKIAISDLSQTTIKNFLIEIEKKEPDFILKQKENKCKFFWLSNEDPDEIKDLNECIWTPYDGEDTIFLEYWYQKALQGKAPMPRVGDYIIDFSRMIQHHYIEKSRVRAIIRCDPSNIPQIYRKSRLDKNFLSNFNQTIIDQINEENSTIAIGRKEIQVKNFTISDKYKSIDFQIINQNSITLKIQEFFYTYIKDMDLSGSFQEFVKILKLEIDDISKQLDKFNIYNIQYLSGVNENTFFKTIITMYTEEGFLYKLVNKVLREKDSILFKQLKFYFISLLAAFQFFASNSMDLQAYGQYIPKDTINEIQTNKRFYVYRGTFLTPEEVDATTKAMEDNNCLIRIFNEFISTSLHKATAEKFQNNCILELEINYEENNGNFAFLNPDLTIFPTEAEVLLRSGSIIKIHKFVPQNKNNQTTYSIFGSLIALSLDKFILSNLNETSLNLWNNNLGKNTGKIRNLADALKVNNSLQQLSLWNNNLGINTEGLKHLADSIRINTSLLQLDLSNNNLGVNDQGLRYLAEALKANISLKELYLSENNLGRNTEGLRHISDALKVNNSLYKLYLSENSLGSNIEGFDYLISAFKVNTSLQQLDLAWNSLETNTDVLKSLSSAIKLNKFLHELNLSCNNLGLNNEGFSYIAEALKQNTALNHLNLSGNNLGSEAAVLNHLAEALQVNTTLKQLDLWDNNLGDNIEGVVYFADKLKFNTSLQKLNLAGNDLGEDKIVNKILADLLLSNPSLKLS